MVKQYFLECEKIFKKKFVKKKEKKKKRVKKKICKNFAQRPEK